MSVSFLHRARSIGPALLVLGCLLAPTQSGYAQSARTNMALLQHLAELCLVDIAVDADTIIVEDPASVTYLASAITSALQDDGKTVYVDEGDRPQAPSLSWVVESAGVHYARSTSRLVQRTVRLDLQYMYVGANGLVLLNGPCSKTLTDTVSRNELAALETAAFPETQADPPPAGWMKRYLEPVVLAVATGLAAFLFFNLRSDRADT